MRYFVAFLSIALFLAACDNLTSRDKYQIATLTDGNAYRLEKASGEVWLIKGNTAEKVQMAPLRLKIGQRYIGEDTYSFTYLGKGSVGDIKTLDDFWLDKDAINAELERRKRK